MTKITPQFSYTGSAVYNLESVELNSNGISLYDEKTGIGGIDFMPYHGAKVRFHVDTSFSDPNVEYFSPTLNNKFYYFVSDQLYTIEEIDNIISLGIEVIGGEEVPYGPLETGGFGGQFTFNNPMDLTYLHLVWSYKNTLKSAPSTYSGVRSSKLVDVLYSSTIGPARVDYVNSGSPSRFKLIWGGNVMADSGYVGLNTLSNYNDLIAAGVSEDDINLVQPLDGLVDNGTGQLVFNRLSLEPITQVLVESPLDSVNWSLSKVDPSLTTFYIDTTDGTVSDVCSQIPATEYYHDGANSLPELGDRIYVFDDGSELYDGNNAYHLMSTTPLVSPPVSGGVYIVVDGNGVVQLVGGCDCTEIAVPTVDQENLQFTLGDNVSLIMSATNNPTSWAIVSPCDQYEITGGSKGTIYSYTDCAGSPVNVTVNYLETRTISAQAVPTVIFGDGSSTLIGPDFSSVLPEGITFDTVTGTLSGTPTSTCEFDVDLIATNCLGDSAPKTVTITIASDIKMTPFLIDIENFKTTGADACLVSTSCVVLFHNGNGDIPTLKDTVYNDHKGIEVFSGGSRWYKIDNSTYSILIDEKGRVCDTHVC